MNRIILLPQYVDRDGRPVYHMHKENTETRTLTPGEFIGVIRFKEDEDTAWMEWGESSQQTLEV